MSPAPSQGLILFPNRFSALRQRPNIFLASKAFHPGTTIPTAQTSSRSMAGKRAWIAIGLATCAVLLIGTSVLALHRLFNLTHYFYHSEPTAAVGKASVSPDDNGTVRRIERLERELRELRRLMPSLPINGKHQANRDIKAIRSNDIARKKGRNLSRHPLKEDTLEDMDVRSPVVDIIRKRDTLQRPVTGGIQDPVDRKDLESIERLSSERGSLGRWSVNTETESSLRARFGPREQRAENDTISFTPLIGGSSTNLIATPPELKETSNLGMVSANDTAVWGNASRSEYTRSLRGTRMVKKRRLFTWYVTTPSVKSAEENLTSQAALDTTERVYKNDAKTTKGQGKVGAQKNIAAPDGLKKFTKNLPATGTNGSVTNDLGMSAASDSRFYNTTETSASGAKFETIVRRVGANYHAPIPASQIQETGKNDTAPGYFPAQEKNNDFIDATSYYIPVDAISYPARSGNATIEQLGSLAETEFINGSSNFDATASTYQGIDEKASAVTPYNASHEVGMENGTFQPSGSSTFPSSVLTLSYFQVTSEEIGEMTVSTPTSTSVSEATNESEEAAFYAPGFSLTTSVDENVTVFLTSSRHINSSEGIRPLVNTIVQLSTLNVSEPTESFNDEANKTAGDAASGAGEKNNYRSSMNLGDRSARRNADNLTATVLGEYTHRQTAGSHEWTNITDITWNKPSLNTPTSSDCPNLTSDGNPVNGTAITASFQSSAGIELVMVASESRNVTSAVSTSLGHRSSSVAEVTMIQSSTMIPSKVQSLTLDFLTGEHSVEGNSMAPSSIQGFRSMEFLRRDSLTEGVQMAELVTTTATVTSKQILPLLRQTGVVSSIKKEVSTTTLGSQEKNITESESEVTPESLISEVMNQSITTTTALFSPNTGSDERETEFCGTLLDNTSSLSGKMASTSTVPPQKDSLRHREATSSFEMLKREARFTGESRSSHSRNESKLPENAPRANQLAHGYELAGSKNDSNTALGDLYYFLKAALEQERKQHQKRKSQEILDDLNEAHVLNTSHFTVSEDDIFPMSDIGEARHAQINDRGMSTAFDTLTSLKERGSASTSLSTAFYGSSRGNLSTWRLPRGGTANAVPQSETHTARNNAFYSLRRNEKAYDSSQFGGMSMSGSEKVPLKGRNKSSSWEYFRNTSNHMDIGSVRGRKTLAITLLPSPALTDLRERKKPAVPSDKEETAPLNVTYAGIVTEPLSAQDVMTIQQAHKQTTTQKSNTAASQTWRPTDKPVHAQNDVPSLSTGNKMETAVAASSREAWLDARTKKSALVAGRKISEFQRPGAVCMYNASHSGWKSKQFFNSLAFIPYEYCSSVLYCCLSLKNEVDIEEFGNHTDLQYLAAAKKLYHGLRTLLAIGGSSSPSASFRHLVSSRVHQDILVQRAARWMQMRHFDGAYLYWPEMQDTEYSDVIGAFRYLATSFNKLGLKLGIILPVSNRAFAMEAAFEALTKDLDGFYDQIFLAPPYSYETSNGSALSYHTEWLPRAYDSYPANLSSVSFCPMIPFWGRTFTMKATLQESTVVLKPAGSGAPRVTSGEPGKVAFFEICRELNDSEHILATREQLMIGNEYVTALTPPSLQRHLSSMVARKPWRCFGTWGVEWDDFGGSCGSVRYPLLKTLYEFQVKHLMKMTAGAAASSAN